MSEEVREAAERGSAPSPATVRRAAERLGTAALLVVLVFVVALPVMNWVPPPTAGDLAVANGVALLVGVVSFGVYGLTRVQSLTFARLVDLGLVYEVVVGLGIATAEVFATYDPFSVVRGVSWICLWITLFPLVVPTTRWRVLIAALATASMGPAAMGLARAWGAPWPDAQTFVYLYLPNYLAAGLALVLHRVLGRLREDVSRAQQMGAYHMIELLGRGGMGEVWRATHRMLARPAAIKLIRPEALSGRASATQRQTLKARFEREARATAQLSSPHTISIYDFGATEDGVLYYVMELLDGTDLETLVAEHGPLPAGRVVHLLKQACESLAEAHRAGLVHRDVKPANLYVCRLGTKVDEVKVLDFGLVALQSGGRLTGDDQITGTPAYLAPEVVRGDREPDERVDVYALGCVAYWLLTGELVFPGKTPFEVLYGHVEEAPTPPSERARQPIPAALEALVLECLEKDPEARPRDAEDLGARLGAVVVEEPWTEAEALAWWQRHGPKPPEKIVEAPAHVRTAFPAREP